MGPYDLAELFNKGYAKANKNSEKGFLKTGIYPQNVDVFKYDDYAPSLTREMISTPESKV